MLLFVAFGCAYFDPKLTDTQRLAAYERQKEEQRKAEEARNGWWGLIEGVCGFAEAVARLCN